MYHCAQLSNKYPEYCWKVDLKRLYDIEQFIVVGKPSCKYKYYSYTIFPTPNVYFVNEDTHVYPRHSNVSRRWQHINLLHTDTDFTRTGLVRLLHATNA